MISKQDRKSIANHQLAWANSLSIALDEFLQRDRNNIWIPIKTSMQAPTHDIFGPGGGWCGQIWPSGVSGYSCCAITAYLLGFRTSLRGPKARHRWDPCQQISCQRIAKWNRFQTSITPPLLFSSRNDTDLLNEEEDESWGAWEATAAKVSILVDLLLDKQTNKKQKTNKQNSHNQLEYFCICTIWV